MKPYYDDGGVTIYCGDSREVLPRLGALGTVITDPVWPNSISSLIGHERPYELFAEMCALLPGNADRLVVQLGFDSDPRFLSGVPIDLPYFRTCWLDYACPSYKGRKLHTGDVAYSFGSAPSFRIGRAVIPGRCVSTQSDWKMPRANKHKETSRRNGDLPHPAPRRIQHLQWLVKWFEDGLVVDPFAGIGTTLVAAKRQGVKAIGIEIDERYCEIAVGRLSQDRLPIGETA